MELRINSTLLEIAGAFTGKYAPYQAVHIEPAAQGGVYVASTDRGAIACLGYDPQGTASEPADLLPSSELLRACKGIKAAERDVAITGNSAVVTTYRKSGNQSVELPVHFAATPSPQLDEVLAVCMERWQQTPRLTQTAGRYDAALLTRALRALDGCSDSLVLSAFDGGPLRLEAENLSLLILLMPQTAEPLPDPPAWARQFRQVRPALRDACQIAQLV